MKTIAILLVLTVLVAGTAIGYLYMSSNVSISEIRVIAVDAASQTEMFENLKLQMEQDRLIGTKFADLNSQNAEDYVFYQYNVTLQNDTAVDAEVAEIRIQPLDGDVLQIGDTQKHNIGSGSSGTVSGTILTKKEMHNVREITVSFHIWGLPFTLKRAYGE